MADRGHHFPTAADVAVKLSNVGKYCPHLHSELLR